MNKNLVIFGFITLCLIAVSVAVFRATSDDPASNAGVNNPTDEQAVKNLVGEFGTKLQMVSLAAPTSTAAAAIRSTYASYVSADLLAAWEKEPSRAPGRLASSPWPDRIEILLMQKDTDGSYVVQAKVVEITSKEAVSGGAANQYAVAMRVRNQNGKWVITGFTKAVQE